MVCARASVERINLDPNAESALGQIAQLPAPMPDLTAFLRRLARGETPTVTGILGALPNDLRDFHTQILDAVKEARKG